VRILASIFRHMQSPLGRRRFEKEQHIGSLKDFWEHCFEHCRHIGLSVYDGWLRYPPKTDRML